MSGATSNVKEKSVAARICEGCGEPIEEGDYLVEFNGEDWHEACFEVSD